MAEPSRDRPRDGGDDSWEWTSEHAEEDSEPERTINPYRALFGDRDARFAPIRYRRVTSRLQILAAVLIAPVFPITTYWSHGEVTEPVLVLATAVLVIWSIAGLFFYADRRWLTKSSED